MKKVIVLIVMYGLFGQISFAQKKPTKHIVEIKKMKFIPAELHVKKGDTVVWINKDFFPHDIAKFDDKKWRSPQLEQGESWSKVITKDEDYYCILHVVMKGKIRLKK